MKKLFGLLIAMAIFQAAEAQKASAFRLGFDLGAAIPKDGGVGALFNLEPQILVMDNLAVGIRMGVAGLAKDVTYYNISQDYEGEVSANVSVSGTANYFFNNGNSRVAPYIGAGFGYYALANVDVREPTSTPSGSGELEADFAWAPMVRVGIELAKFRLGAEYNLVPPSNLQDVNGQVIGEAANQYFGITLGVTIGGGKWGK